MRFACFVGLLLAIQLSQARASIVGGTKTYVNYNSRCGTWNDPTTRRGFFMDECCPVDATYPGNPWQQLSVHYQRAGTPYLFKGNTGRSSCPSYQVLSERVLDDGTGLVGIEHVMKMGDLTLTKTESWDFHGKTLHITFKAKLNQADCYPECRPITNLTVMHAVDPDQDRIPFLTYTTINDVIHGGRMAEAVGPRSCQSMAYGICDPKVDKVGFTNWVCDPLANLIDPNGQFRDHTMHYQHRERRGLECGDEREFSFFVVWGRCHDEARKLFASAHRRFCPCNQPLFLDPNPRTPRCRGQCPCVNSGTTCECKACPVGPTFEVADKNLLDAEEFVLKAKCGPRRRRRLATEKTDEIKAEVAELEKELSTNENVINNEPDETTCA